MNTMSDFQVGQRVTFGRRNGEKTLGEVVRKGRSKLKVKQLESRGAMKSHPVGTIWTVPPSLCEPVNGTAAPAAPKAKRSEAAILADAERIMFALEPEMLYCDGERSPSEARRVAARLRQQFRDLEAELGRKITEYAIDGAMPANLSFGTAKSSGWKIGDKVAFDDRQGNEVVGYVKRVNTKSISVQPLGGGTRYWRVGPSLLRAA